MASHSSAPAPPDPSSMHTALTPDPNPPTHSQLSQTLQLAQARRYGPCELVEAEISASTSTHSAVAHRQPQHPQPCTQPSLHIHTPSTPPHTHAATTGEGGKEPPPHPALSNPLHSLPPCLCLSSIMLAPTPNTLMPHPWLHCHGPTAHCHIPMPLPPHLPPYHWGPSSHRNTPSQQSPSPSLHLITTSCPTLLTP